MFKVFQFVAIIIWWINSFVVFAESNLDKRLAVMNFNGGEKFHEEAQTLSELIRSQFVNQLKPSGYEVIERTEMETLLREVSIQLHDCTESNCAVRAGEILNVRWVVIGSVSKLDTQYIVAARLVDVQTGQIKNSTIKIQDRLSNFITVLDDLVKL